ncbi:MAG: hypothetical protein MUF09_10440 [Candidatus Nanopelagicales bacterium]|jgi:hypothetical protein|nr:hypothetical protein [Candidatus Nanopelagicales bacterium]
MQKRPGVISLIGWLLIIGAAFSAVGGIVTIAFRNTDSVLEATGATSAELLFAGGLVLAVAAIQGLIGAGILSGSRISRGIVAFVQVLNVAGAAFVMFSHHTGAFLYQGLITVGVALFVLWGLFNDKADEYYNAA